MNVLYKTVLRNPQGLVRVYVGIHSLNRGPLWTPKNQEGYIGSSGVFCKSLKESGYVKWLKPGWRVLSVTVLQHDATLKDEERLIKDYQEHYGIAPECRSLINWNCKPGICINVSRGSANLAQPEVKKKAADARTAYYRTEEGRKDLRGRLSNYTPEMRSKYLKSERSHLARLVESSHTAEAKAKWRRTYAESGNAKRVSDIGNAAIIAKARRCIMNDGFVGVVSEVAKHTGLNKGSVGAKFTLAYRNGESTCMGWTFKPYKV